MQTATDEQADHSVRMPAAISAYTEQHAVVQISVHRLYNYHPHDLVTRLHVFMCCLHVERMERAAAHACMLHYVVTLSCFTQSHAGLKTLGCACTYLSNDVHPK